MTPSGVRTPQAIMASLGFSQDTMSLSIISQGTTTTMSPSGFSQDTVRLSGISQETLGYPEAVGAQDTPNHREAVRPSARRPLESLPGQARRPALVFRQWKRGGRNSQARGHGALARAGVVTLEVPRVPGSAPLVSLHPTPGSSLRAPEAVAAPTLTQRRAPKSRSSWC